MNSVHHGLRRLPIFLGLLLATGLSCNGADHEAAAGALRPSGGDWPPVIGAWFWNDETLAPDGHKQFLDAAAAHSPYTLISTSLRISKGEVVETHVRERLGEAVRYADKLGLKIALDLDIRLARRAFRARYPDEQQEELVLKTAELSADGKAEILFAGKDLSDHMTGGTIPYQCITTRLVRAYSFVRGSAGIESNTVQEIPGEHVRALADGPAKLSVSVSAGSNATGRSVCVIVAHSYLAPDVFAPHLLEFQREIIRQYADLPLAGIMKDEWGFPPDHTGNPAHDRSWYSSAFAKAYTEQSGGRDLVRDALLMFSAEKGLDRERRAAINLYRKLCRERNVAVEDDFYRAGKATFGAQSIVVVHATWTPYPGVQEFRKNGLDWWDATRDIGQTDESTPYSCRTSLAKRWGYPLWYNQYYSSDPPAYEAQLWAGALSGGRLNVHPVYPRPKNFQGDGHLKLLSGKLMTAMTRLRMLDFITQAPLDCPVAVIFGHACAMNWAGPSYNRVGLEVASALCADGYLTDLFPSSLVGTSALRIDNDGYVCLGPQRYRAVVLYQPEFCDEKELEFFGKAAHGKSAVFVAGDWTLDSGARPMEVAARLEGVRKCGDDGACVEGVKRVLGEAGVARVTGWSGRLTGWGQGGKVEHASPPADGHSVFTDGTYVRIAGSKDSAGDLISETFRCQGSEVTVDAVGVVAVRFAADGKIAAFAAGGLKSLKTGSLSLVLAERTDLAFRTDPDGKVRGVIQGCVGPIPEPLLAITSEWQRLAVPPLLP